MRVVVIGSGIVGAGAAYHLSRRGVAVTVVDGGFPGEATQAGAGIVCPWVDHPEDDDWYRLTREGARHYPGLVEELGEDIGYAKVGALLVAEDPVDLEPVRALLRRRHAGAPEMGEVVDVPTPVELFPPLSDTLSALLVPGAARVNGRQVRDALLAAAVARGAEIRTGTATLTSDGQVLLHPTDDETGGTVASRASSPAVTPGGTASVPEAGGSAAAGTASQRVTHPGTERAETERREAAGPAAGRPGADGAAAARVGAAEPAHGRPGGTGPEAAGPGGAGTEGERAASGRRDAGGGSWRQSAPDASSAPTMPGVCKTPTGEGVPLEADRVIVAAGAWTGEVCRPLGVELPVFPRRGQILHATLEGVDTAWWPIILPRQGPYLLGFPDSRVVVGATVEDVGFAPRVTVGGLDEVIAAGLRVAPGLASATVSETRVGLRPVYAPGPALIGPVTDRVVVATGLSAYGLTAGPFTGEIAAALVLGERPPIDITPYLPPRSS
ncbi:NAD(P)/FAD-dependent oxidoreductase [Nonomuraea sp. NPDC049309]|uniref:NAD(P)/FAD-dependent oxidoreductase n=1 Tax=Nonomuraea sp. NPDC049309 TaxID=3364350 RepID=UPI0037179932